MASSITSLHPSSVRRLSICNGGTGTFIRLGLQIMTLKDLQNAVTFLRRLSVGQMEADQLIATVEALEAEIKKRRQKK